VNETIVIMDHNKLQSDRQVQEIINLGEIENKVSTFGWHVERCDGHDFESIERVFKNIEKIKDKPKFIIMDTVKGKGVGFMEHPKELEVNDGFYRWHSGAPSDDNYKLAIEDLINGLTERCQQYDTKFFDFKFPQKDQAPAWSQDSEVIAKGYGRTLVELGKVNKDFVVIDADLSMDCQVLDFENAYPDRFFENGIAEQDMTSMACGFAGQGITPVINSFATFLAARANEQIYNAQTENRKIIYACHFAGILPSAPGKSHQSVRDISLFGALPNVTIMQACCEEEMEMVTRYAVMDSKESCMLRINIGTTPRKLKLPKDYQLTFGQGVKMNDRGSENIVLSYGPYVLNEVLKATDLLEEQKIPFTAVNMPWLNRFDAEWFKGLLKGCKNLYIVEDHMSFGGMGDSLIQFLNERSLLDGIRFHKWGFTEFPKCGTPLEALRAHKIDDESLAMRFKETLN
jgi:transketolase